jgi:hypothetical protein
MITFSELGNYGRLGNVLFQYATILSVGLENNYEVKIPNYNNRIWDGQNCLLNNFKITASFLDSSDKILYQYNEKREDEFKYNSEIYQVPDNTNIFGFFQNYKYLEKYQDIIRKELSLKDEISYYSKEYFIKLKEKYNTQIISVHLRRGDTNLNMYSSNGVDLDYNSLWYQYFIKAKQHFKNCKFLIFTGGLKKEDQTEEYNWIKRNFIEDEYIVTLDNFERNTINDMALMLECNGHILSPVSSYSYMIGFLNAKKNKTIIAPEKYYFLQQSMVSNFYPPEFIKEV